MFKNLNEIVFGKKYLIIFLFVFILFSSFVFFASVSEAQSTAGIDMGTYWKSPWTSGPCQGWTASKCNTVSSPSTYYYNVNFNTGGVSCWITGLSETYSTQCGYVDPCIGKTCSPGCYPSPVGNPKGNTGSSYCAEAYCNSLKNFVGSNNDGSCLGFNCNPYSAQCGFIDPCAGLDCSSSNVCSGTTLYPGYCVKYEGYCRTADNTMYSQVTPVYNSPSCGYVAPLPTPYVHISASPSDINPGQSSTITWTADNSTSCTAQGQWSGSKQVSGSFSTGPMYSSGYYGYSLACTGAGGTAYGSALVYVIPPPSPASVSISVNPSSITSGSSSTISWSSSDATSCNASGDWSGSKATSGSQSTGTLTASKTYTLTCTGNAGEGSNSATIIVNAPLVMSGTLAPATSSCSIPSGSSTCNINFSWTTTNPVGTSAVTKPVNINVGTGNSGTNIPFSVKYNSQTFYLYNNAQLLAQSTVTSSCATDTSWDSGQGMCTSIAPTVNFVVNPTSIIPGGTSTITWSSTHATSCTGTNFNTNNATSGTVTVTPASTTTYSIVCTGPGGQAQAGQSGGQSTVNVTPTGKKPIFNEN
jgi:hypothetical protein